MPSNCLQQWMTGVDSTQGSGWSIFQIHYFHVFAISIAIYADEEGGRSGKQCNNGYNWTLKAISWPVSGGCGCLLWYVRLSELVGWLTASWLDDLRSTVHPFNVANGSSEITTCVRTRWRRRLLGKVNWNAFLIDIGGDGCGGMWTAFGGDRRRLLERKSIRREE